MPEFSCAGDSAGAPVFTQSLPHAESKPPIPDEIKAFIVMGLARFQTPSEVVEAVKKEFGVQVSRQHVYGYDPRCTKPPAPRWRALHAATRAAYLSDLAEIGIAHKAVRLRLLDQMTHAALEGHYLEDAAAFLEQAAKECGGVYERKAPER
jgi:hypothetical protein